MIGRFLRTVTTAETLGILLLGFALQILSYGVASSLRTTETGSFLWICLAAAAVSYGMGRRKWRGIQASAGLAALGMALVWILGARLVIPLVSLLREGISLLPQLIPYIENGTPFDVTAVLEAWTLIAQASSTLWVRLQTWTMGFDTSVAINDPLVRGMVWTLILWLCAAWVGWFAEKRNAVASLLPAILLLALVTSYSEYRIENLWMMVVLLLFLMGTWNYRNHTLQWISRRIDFSDSIRIDNGQAVIFLTIAVGTLAFITPSVSWRDLLDRIRTWREGNETAEMLGIQEPRSSGNPTASQAPSLPRDHLLGGGFENSERLVMTVRTGELPPLPAEMLPSAPPRYYWRSAVYDRYVGSGWVSGNFFPQTVPVNTPLIPGLLREHRLVHLDVRLVEPQGSLYWSGILFSADLPLTANWRVRPPSDLFADQSALLQSDLFTVSSAATAYQAEAYIPIPSLQDLRAASAEYPDQIRDTYLSLPRSVPNRVRDLARQITEGLINPYEKAKAIETHLRTNYPYDLTISAPPSSRDVADYFLFDLKRGYCDYYATAMVVLARASGLPARFVSGYAPGSYDAPNAQYVVRELDAHSWAEVYFPEIGWVEFEPTASLPAIERVEESAPLDAGQGGEETASRLLARFRLGQIVLWTSPLLVLLCAALLYFAFLERWLVLRLAPAAAIEDIYQRFYRAARPLAGPWTRAETSTEFLHKVRDASALLEARGHRRRLLAEVRTNAVLLTDIYHRSLFVDHITERSDVVHAWRVWRQLRKRLIVAKLIHKLSSSVRAMQEDLTTGQS